MARLGMDVDEVERLGRELRSHAERLGATKDSIARVLAGSRGLWQGRDADDFERVGRQTERELTRLVADVRAFGDEALRQAREQRDVSRAPGAPGGHPAMTPRREGDFGRRLQGKEHHSEDRELAGLARAAYRGEDAGSFTAVRTISLPDGFQAVLYRDEGGAGTADDRFVLAFAGTDPRSLDDWANNGAQLVGLSTQYAEAMGLAIALHHEYGDRLVLTGHSLGGGLAAASAVATGCPAVTFNAAGVSPVTMAQASALRGRFLPWEVGKAYAEVEGGQVRNYQTYGDVLTTTAESNGPLIPDAAGVHIDLDSPAPATGENVVGWAFGEHGMDSVITAMDEKYDDPHGASGSW